MRTSKYERETAEAIHKVERYVEDRYRSLGGDASVRVHPETYYSDDGSPSRFLSVHYPSTRVEVRINLQRNTKGKHAWSLGQSTYVHDQLTYEFEKDFTNLPNVLRHLRENMLGGDASPSAWLQYGGRTFLVRDVRPPTDEELIGLGVSPGARHQFVAGIPPGLKYHAVYDRTYLLKE